MPNRLGVMSLIGAGVLFYWIDLYIIDYFVVYMLTTSFGSRLVRTALFIDGGYYDIVNKYYLFSHVRHSPLNLEGLMEFVRFKVAEKEKAPDPSLCQMVEAHYFRGRFSTAAAIQAGKLEDERRFDERLMRAGIIQHYLPLDETQPKAKERGIDVWLALEAFDLAVHKRFDVLALMACDGDYVPLVRKLNGIGTRVMLLSWDFQYQFTDSHGAARVASTRTSEALIRNATYPLSMHALIDDRTLKDQDEINNLFCR